MSHESGVHTVETASRIKNQVPCRQLYLWTPYVSSIISYRRHIRPAAQEKGSRDIGSDTMRSSVDLTDRIVHVIAKRLAAL